MSVERLREPLLAQLSIGGLDACWDWKGLRSPNGYGRLNAVGKPHYIHRLAYRFWRGEIPTGLHIDHLCRNRLCGNPRHMELVTNRTNVLRGVGPSAENARKTHCIHGHEFSQENTRIRRDGARTCLTCEKAARRRADTPAFRERERLRHRENRRRARERIG